MVRNLTPAAIEESIDRIEKAIRNCQIIMLPGGFSGGDEPAGSGKFIATTFRNPRIKDAIDQLLQQRRADTRNMQRISGADKARPCPIRQDYGFVRTRPPP